MDDELERTAYHEAGHADELLAHATLELEQIEEVLTEWLPASTCRNWRTMF